MILRRYRRIEEISSTGYRLDQAMIAVAELGAQLSNALADGIASHDHIWPYGIEKLLLGHKPSTNGNGQRPVQSTQSTVRQAAPVSAPPTREAPSMSTGRAPTPTSVRLNAAEREIAAALLVSRPDLKDQAGAEREYARQKLRMHREKAEAGGQ